MNAQDFKALQVLVTVQREGGFAPAARHLGVTRAAVSRAIAQLEVRRQVRLARRTTRQVVLTEAAQELVARCSASIRMLDEALAAVGEHEGQLAGTVRVGGSAAFGRDVLVPLGLRFRAQHPGVHIDFALSDRVDDLIAQPIDVAVRLGPLPESSMIARPVGHLPLVLAAAPSLVAELGLPKRIDDLAHWPAVGFRVPGTAQRYAWPFLDRGRRRQFEPASSVADSDSIDAVAALVRAGTGIAMVPRHLVEADLRERRLLALLPPGVAPGPAVHVCYAQRELVPRRARALIDWLVQNLPAHCSDGARRAAGVGGAARRR
jgi:DNA-binding transcriptional LysR family regulator